MLRKPSSFQVIGVPDALPDGKALSREVDRKYRTWLRRRGFPEENGFRMRRQIAPKPNTES